MKNERSYRVSYFYSDGDKKLIGYIDIINGVSPSEPMIKASIKDKWARIKYNGSINSVEIISVD